MLDLELVNVYGLMFKKNVFIILLVCSKVIVTV